MSQPPVPTRLIIADDHPMVADGIEAILETYDDIDVVAKLSTGQEVVDQIADLAPDVILMDLNMPQLGGLPATEILLERQPDLKIIILSMHDAPEYVSAAMSHGASGFVLKDVPTEDIYTAICEVMAGNTYLCRGASAALAPKTSDGREPLTAREQTILLELAQGKSNKQVALDLDISVHTVETHRKNIKRKLGINSTAGLTRYAMAHGVLQGTGVAI